jgi:hypothetical protein
MMGTSNIREYSRALRMRMELITGMPSSVKVTAPALINSPISDISSPFIPFVMVAAGNTLIGPFSASSFINRTSAWLSITGSVLGIVHTEVKPLLAATVEPP